MGVRFLTKTCIYNLICIIHYYVRKGVALSDFLAHNSVKIMIVAIAIDNLKELYLVKENKICVWIALKLYIEYVTFSDMVIGGPPY